MYYTSINLDNICLQDQDDQFINIKYNNNPLIFKTPIMYIPFGLEKEYNNYGIKLQFRRTQKDIVEFYNFINSLEDKLKNLLDNNNLKSQIRPANGRYDPLLITKIARNKEKLTIDVNYSSESINIYNLKKKIYGVATLMLDNIFKKDDIYYYKLKIKELEIKEFCV